MRRFSIAFVAWATLCATASASPTCDASPTTVSDRRADPTSARLVVGAWNAEWLFDGQNDVNASPYSGGNVAGANAHVSDVANVVDALDADVLVLVEAETCDVLERAAGSGNATTTYAAHMVQGTDTYTMQNVGLLTKIDVVSALTRVEDRGDYDSSTSTCAWSGRKDSGVSKHFLARVRVNDRYVSIIGAHLKAFPTDASSCAQREAQVEVLRALARARYEAGDAVVVAGDLNDFSELHADSDNNAPTSRVLAKLRDFDDDGVDELEEAVGSRVSQNDRYTWSSSTGSSRSKVDYILTSSSDIRVVSASIRHDLVTNAISDHYPLLATIEILATRDETSTKSKGIVGPVLYVIAALAVVVGVGLARKFGACKNKLAAK